MRPRVTFLHFTGRRPTDRMERSRCLQLLNEKSRGRQEHSFFICFDRSIERGGRQQQDLLIHRLAAAGSRMLTCAHAAV